MKDKIILTAKSRGFTELLISLKEGPKSFIELRKTLSEFGPSTISKRLKDAVELGIIKKTAKIKGNRAYVVYELTPLGKKVLRYIEEIEEAYRKLASELIGSSGG